MIFRKKKPQAFDSPILVIDALGIAQKIKTSNHKEILELGDRLDRNFYRFRNAIPFEFVISTRKHIYGSGEYSFFRLNDMFVMYSKTPKHSLATRYLISASLTYQSLLLDGFIPRGGLGYGLVLPGKDSLIGSGFIDAYTAAEQRSPRSKNICSILVSKEFLRVMPESERNCRTLCFYEGDFFINPLFLIDPELGEFSKQSIIDMLINAGANEEKLKATEHFLDQYEDYDMALEEGSKSRIYFGNPRPQRNN